MHGKRAPQDTPDPNNTPVAPKCGCVTSRGNFEVCRRALGPSGLIPSAARHPFRHMVKRFRAQQKSKTTNAHVLRKAAGGRHIFSVPSTTYTKPFTSVCASYLIDELVAADLKGLDPLQGIVREHFAHDIQRLVEQTTTATHNHKKKKKKTGSEGIIKRRK